LGIGAAVATVLGAIFSPSFRGYLKRMGQVVLGWIGMGVKAAETPEVVAQRIIDQLNAAKPEYNRKVQQASTLTEKIAIQLRDEKAKVAELESTINALLTDKDDSNDHLAAGMIAAQKNLQGSVTANAEQLKLAQGNLEEIKAERTRFFQEREEMLAKINAQLTRAKSAEIQKAMADLKGGFEVGSVKDSMDRLNDIVNEKEAEAKGSKDAAESNPDEIIKKAKESVRNSEVLEEIARRKAEIAKKQQEGKDKAGSALLSGYAAVAGVPLLLASMGLSGGVAALIGAIAGFVIGAGIGWNTSDKGAHGGDFGFRLFFDMARAVFFGLVGAVVLAIVGAFVGPMI
jgi:phage shock protein A